MKVLITTPFFQNLGGSELETIHTANEIATFEFVKKIDLYVEGGFDLNFINDIFINKKIAFYRKKNFFDNKIVRTLDKIWVKKLKKSEKISDFLYWNFFNINKYDKVYIITKTSLSYFIPILKRINNLENVLIKYTTFFYEPLPKGNHKYIIQVKSNLVTSKQQVSYFKNVLKISNTEDQEVILFNEVYALEKNRQLEKNNKNYDFGVLGRFYKEKQLEDAVLLIESLKEKGFECTLLIRGGGLENYFMDIKKMVQDKNLENLITLQFESVPYNKAYDFFDSIDCFLVTSKYEGGPNVALEVMAYGLPIISYNVGAMKDRLEDFPELIAENFDEMVAISILYLENKESLFNSYCEKLKERYIAKYSNSNKINYIFDFLNDKPNL